MILRPVSWLLFWGGFLSASPLSSQAPESAPAPESASVVVQADQLYSALQPAAALTLLESALADETSAFEELWRASRAAFAMGVLEEIEEVRDGLYDRAIGYSERAVALSPERTEGHFWVAASLGRRALGSGARQRADFAGRILVSAERVLKIDSLHAGAHHVLGRVNYEVMDLSRVARWVARNFMGNPALEDSSWEKARSYLERAVELDGDVVVHRLDLARLYARRGEDELARGQIVALLGLPVREPFDEQLFEEAEALNEKLDG